VGTELRDTIKNFVLDAKESEVDLLEAEVAGRKDKAGALPIAAAIAALKRRLAVQVCGVGCIVWCRVYYIVLYCIVLHCIVLYCRVYCVMYCIVL
jgi:hypothetical protein